MLKSNPYYQTYRPPKKIIHFQKKMFNRIQLFRSCIKIPFRAQLLRVHAKFSIPKILYVYMRLNTWLHLDLYPKRDFNTASY